MAVTITITDAGRAEIINAENNGTAPVLMSEIRFGSGQYTPTASQTALQTEIKSLTSISGDAVADDIIHVTCRDESTDAYEVYEFGLFTDSGTLFAVYSQTGTPIIDKAAGSVALLAVDIMLQNIGAGSLTFGNTDFMLPPATETTQGIAALATAAEVQAGTEDTKIVTSATLATLTATETRAGLIERASQAEAEGGTDNARAMTPARVKSYTSQFGIGDIKSIANADTQLESGLYSMPAALGATGSPIASESGALLVIRGGADTNYVQQMWSHSNDTDNQRTFFRHKKGAGAWSPWREMMHTGNAASAAEVQAGTESVKWIAPDTLAALTATETRSGLAELATIAEAETGTDTQRATTPAGVKAAIEALGFSGSGIQTVWTGSVSSSVLLTDLPGGHPGNGFYLIDANAIYCLNVRENTQCVTVGDIYSSPGSDYSNIYRVGHSGSNRITVVDHDIDLPSGSVRTSALTIYAIYKVV